MSGDTSVLPRVLTTGVTLSHTKPLNSKTAYNDSHDRQDERVHLSPCTTFDIPKHRLTQAMYDAKERSL
jgi:hypothetical protein